MTIVYEGPGDIFDYNCDALVCPVNVKGAMGAGLALAFRNRCPGLYRAYREACQSGQLTTRSLFLYRPEEKGPAVLCLPTKDSPWDNSCRFQIEEIIKVLAGQWRELRLRSIAMPPIGCGLGRLDYHIVLKPLLYRYLDPLELPVYILLPQADASIPQFD